VDTFGRPIAADTFPTLTDQHASEIEALSSRGVKEEPGRRRGAEHAPRGLDKEMMRD
jgi:hypothetical protein